jgi:C_GCAxxG_C_C family probable redox protein
MNYAEIAVNKFNDGFNCAQSIVFAFSDRLKTEAETGFKAATGFGGGMGRKQEVCGAVSGGAITLSLLLGRGKSDGPEKQETAFTAVRALLDAFEQKYGTVICGRLLDGCDLLTPEGQERFTTEKMKTERCCKYVADVAVFLELIIKKNGR